MQTNLPDSDGVNCFAVSGTNVFVETALGRFNSSGGNPPSCRQGVLKDPDKGIPHSCRSSTPSGA